jgi:hypothetical protein
VLPGDIAVSSASCWLDMGTRVARGLYAKRGSDASADFGQFWVGCAAPHRAVARYIRRRALVAQLAEAAALNSSSVGSSPTGGTPVWAGESGNSGAECLEYAGRRKQCGVPCAVKLSPARSTVSICWPLRRAYRAGSSKANARHCAGRFTDWPVRHQSEQSRRAGVLGQVKAGVRPAVTGSSGWSPTSGIALASMFSSSLICFVACYPRKEVHTKRRTV